MIQLEQNKNKGHEMVAYNDFCRLVESFKRSTKDTYNLTKMFEKHSLVEIKNFTEKAGGKFIDAKDVVNFLLNNQAEDLKKQYGFFIIISFDNASNEMIVRFRKKL